jgi:hypothetical protein
MNMEKNVIFNKKKNYYYILIYVFFFFFLIIFCYIFNINLYYLGDLFNLLIF